MLNPISVVKGYVYVCSIVLASDCWGKTKETVAKTGIHFTGQFNLEKVFQPNGGNKCFKVVCAILEIMPSLY